MDEIIVENSNSATISNLKVDSFALNTHVKAVKFISNLLFFGIGNKIHCYDWKKKIIIDTEVVFCSTNSIHGIRIISDDSAEIKLLLFGGKSIRVYKYFNEPIAKRFRPLTDECFLMDWIHDAKVHRSSKHDGVISVVLAHNSINFWNWKQAKLCSEVHCAEKCILYSACVLCTHSEGVIVAAGTVFKEILIWSADIKPVDSEKHPSSLHQLTGHQGVVFSLTFNQSLLLLCSTSDDRTLIIWKIIPDEETLNIRSLDFWTKCSFQLHSVCYAHESRVWSSVILPQCIISIGEDSTVCFWKHDGSFIQRDKCHNGGSIWCIDANSDSSFVATGGSDSGVLLWNVSKLSNSALKLLSIPIEMTPNAQDFPRNVLLLYKDNLHHVLVTTDCGEVLLYDMKKGSWLFEHFDNTFSSYCLLSLSPDNSFVFMGNIDGEISVFSYGKTEFKHCSKLKVLDHKVTGIHWVTHNSDFVLTCGISGNMVLWEVECEFPDIHLLRVDGMLLPKNKRHWWSTAGAYIESMDLLVVGDRVGSLHVYTNVGDESSPMQIKPIATYFGIHGKHGVTDLKANKDLIYSCGRDGKLIVFQASADGIFKLHYVKVPHDLEWISKIMFVADDIILQGFHGKEFLCWSTKHDRMLMNVCCGGGHRQWDFSLVKNQPMIFTAVKKKEILLASEYAKFVAEEPAVKFGIYGMPIRCLCFINTITDNKQADLSIIACGGEDPTLKIIAVKSHMLYAPSISVLHSISAHLSNVRAITKCKIDGKETSYLLISVGGRAQMCASKVTFHPDKKRRLPKFNYGVICQLLGTDFIWNVDKPVNKPWKDKQKQVVDAQTRYMDVNVRQIAEVEFLIATACSDAFFRVHKLNIQTCEFNLMQAIPNSEHCVLKVSMLTSEESSRCVLATVATDGCLRIWNCSLENDSNQENSENAEIPVQIPVFRKKLQQSGINALQVKRLEDNKWLFCLGGDDNSLSISLLHLDLCDQDGLKLIAVYTEPHAHASQITGVHILSTNLLASVSIDQRLNIWFWEQGENRLNLKLLYSKMSYVADISNLEVWESRESHYWTAAVCGEGLEIFKINASDAKFF